MRQTLKYVNTKLAISWLDFLHHSFEFPFKNIFLSKDNIKQKKMQWNNEYSHSRIRSGLASGKQTSSYTPEDKDM